MRNLNARSPSIRNAKPRERRKLIQPADRDSAASQKTEGIELADFGSAQMRDAEEAAFARGVDVETLMDRAGAGVAQSLNFSRPESALFSPGRSQRGDAWLRHNVCGAAVGRSKCGSYWESRQ
jgi:hypothetical protein